VSVTAVGPALDLDGPLPVARRHALLSTPAVDVVFDDEGRWLNGVNVIGYPDGPPKLWEPCSTGTFRVKEDGAAAPQDRFDPIAVYVSLPCSTLGMGDYDVFARRAELVLEATLSHGIEEAFAGGVLTSNNPFLGDASLTALAGGAAVAPRVGLSYLENAIGSLTGRQGLIHATPAVVDRWGEGLDVIAELRTAAGTPVVSGSGYIGVDPVGKTASGATTEWAFATGPVEAKVSPFVTTTVEETVDRSDNSVVVRAERFALVEWDTALQVGVLIDWSIL
jgi:hypothetical protein